jgi:tetratricopeptide (TPR) repeat protein
MRGDYDRAHHLQTQTLAIAEAMSDPTALGIAHTQIGLIGLYRGDFAGARERFQRALGYHEQTGNLHEIAGTLHNLGMVHYYRENIAESRAMLERALEMRERIGHETGIAESAGNLGVIAARQGDHPAARAAYERAVAIHLKSGDRFGVVTYINNLGHLALQQGDTLHALDQFKQALRQAWTDDRTDARFGVFEALAGFAGAALQLGDNEDAAELAGLIDAQLDPTPTNIVRQEYLVPLMDELRAIMPDAELESLLDIGRALDLTTVIENLLA